MLISKKFSELIGNVDPNQIYYLDTCVLIAANRPNSNSWDDQQARTLLDEIFSKAFAVTTASITLPEIHSAIRRSQLDAHKRENPSQQDWGDKQIFYKNPQLIAEIAQTAKTLQESVIGNPALECICESSNPQLHIVANELFEQFGQDAHLDYNDIRHLMAMKANSINTMITMDEGYKCIDDKYFSFYFPDNSKAHKYISHPLKKTISIPII